MTAPLWPATWPTQMRWAVFSLACGASWLLYLHRYAFALIKPELVKEWGLSKSELGWLDSAFAATSVGFQIPLGVAADALGVHLVLTALVVVWCLGLAMHAWAPTPKWLYVARLIFGLGQSAVYACLSRLAQTWFPPPIRTTLQGLAGITAGRLGGLCAYILFSTVLLGLWGLDWRTATYLFAGGGLLFGLTFVALFRNSPRNHPLVNEAEAELIVPQAAGGIDRQERMSVGQLLRAVKRDRLVNLYFLNIQTILSTFADNIYSNWIPLFLWEVHRLEYAKMGIYSSLPLLGGALAGFVAGALNDWLIARTGNRRWVRSGVAFCGKTLAAVLLLLALLWYDQPFVFCGMLFFVKFFGDWSLTASWAVVTDIGGRASASVFAFNNTVAGVALFAAPAIFGHVAEHYGWPLVFVTVAAAYVLCALSWLVIDCTQRLVD